MCAHSRMGGDIWELVSEDIIGGQDYATTKPDQYITGEHNYRQMPLMNINIQIINKIVAN